MSDQVTSWIRRAIIGLSDKIVYASTPYVQMKSQLNDASTELIDFTRSPSTEADESLLEFVGLLRPWTASGVELQRVGGPGDGGYVLATPVQADAAVSVGIGRDVSWDTAIGGLGIPVAMFDPTIRRLPNPVPGGAFHRLGVGIDRPTYRPLSELIAVAGIEDSTELILKLDVEGAEWQALADPELDLSRFRQILVEFHGLSCLKDPREAQRAVQILKRVVAQHKPMHLHANNYDEVVRFGSYWFPNAIEVTFVRQDLGSAWSLATMLRTDLDRPNDSRVSDIDISSVVHVANRGLNGG